MVARIYIHFGRLVANLVEGISTFDVLDPKLIPAVSKERDWADKQTQSLTEAIASYDQLWNEWRKLIADRPECSTLPKDRARGDKPGLGAGVDKYRQAIK